MHDDDDDDDDVDETMIRFHIWQCKSASYGVGLSLPTPPFSLLLRCSLNGCGLLARTGLCARQPLT